MLSSRRFLTWYPDDPVPLVGETFAKRTEGGVGRPEMTLSLEQIDILLAPQGLIPRGALRLNPSEARALSAKSLVLIGHAGSSIWPHFQKWLSKQNEPPANPLDAWSEHVITPIAAEARRPRRLPLSKALSPVPAMGDARRRPEAFAARHSHSPGLRPLARLSRRDCF